MKATFDRKSLLAACQTCKPAIAGGNSKPILRNLKAVVQDGRCTLTATDLEMGIRVEVSGAKAEDNGEVLLPSEHVIAALSAGTDEEVSIEEDGNALWLRGTRSEYEFPTGDVKDFPDVPTFPEEDYCDVPAELLGTMIRRTLYAVATESIRYAMTGAWFELAKDRLTLVGTDGHRLALAEGGGVSPYGKQPGAGVIVPSRALQALARSINGDAQVGVSLTGTEGLFRTDHVLVYTRLVEGRYPAYREVFPKKKGQVIPLPIADLTAALRQIVIVSDDSYRRADFSFAKGKLTLQAQGAETGRSKVEMPVEYDGKAIKIILRPLHVLDLLKPLPADGTISLTLVDPTTPALFTLDDCNRYLIVPLS